MANGDQSAIGPRLESAAKGRWLGDFEPLSDLERALVAAAAAGEWLRLGDNRPSIATGENTIRAALLRFLALGGDSASPVHEAGIQIAGAWIAGSLRLSACDIQSRITLINCVLDAPLHAFDARLRSLNLSGSRIAALRADRIVVAGNLTLRVGFVAEDVVSLTEARIGGGIDCGEACFNATNGPAMEASGASIGGLLNLGHGFVSTGEIRLIGTKIGGDLVCSGGHFKASGEIAIGADRVQVMGDALFDRVMVAGTLRLAGATIGGHLSLDGARINGGDTALQAEHIRVGRALILRNAEINGRMMLTDGYAISLADDLDSWPRRSVILDGFRYDRIAGHDVSIPLRIDWLMHQIDEDIGTNFRPQPWEQLIRVLRDMGHDRGANIVAIEKQRAMRRAGRIGARIPHTDRSRHPVASDKGAIHRKARVSVRRGVKLLQCALHDAYGLFAGYGYRPERIVMWMIAMWFASGLYYSHAAERGIIAPAEPTLLIAALDGSKRPHATYGPGSCGVRHEVPSALYWPSCPGLPSEYSHFNAWLFSADLILPLVDFRQFTYWAPAATYTTRDGKVRPMTEGTVTKAIQWIEVLFGWTMSLLFGAIVTRIVERD